MRDAFAALFADHGEVGAAVCVYDGGRPVVDLWGGVADRTTQRPWAEDTIVGVFSATKGVTAIGANLLVQRGVLDPEAPLATWWPEFAANGKSDITLGQVLSHRAGLPLVEGECTLDEALAWFPMVERLAAQAPLWAPGTQHGYHMRTFGWLVGEVIRRVTGASPGAFLRSEVLDPVDADFWVGLPAALEPRVAPVITPRKSPGSVLAELGDLLLAKVFPNPGGHFDYDDMWNTRRMRAAELPSSNGIGSARGLARLYASCVGDGVDGVRTLDDETVAGAIVPRATGPDAVLMRETSFGLGFMLGTAFGAANPPRAFGHGGAGGSISLADPDTGRSVAYVMNHLRFDPAGDPRAESIVRAAFSPR